MPGLVAHQLSKNYSEVIRGSRPKLPEDFGRHTRATPPAAPSTYGDLATNPAALADFSHTFAEGRITTVLGPSGSGKSTLLALLAGLLTPGTGRISWNGEDITHVPAERRDFGVVFQDYVLFPHLTVEENVQFGLKTRGISTAERRRRAQEALELLRISHLASRRKHQISGGEQQRVAIARAVAFRPRALLMDEPLSALDARLRDELRLELSSLLKSLGLTTVYVTHDQAEALSMGDELIILRHGQVQQTGAPAEVYRHPANPFVAGFLGAANVVAGECARLPEGAFVLLPFGRFPVESASKEGHCWAVIRPEDLEIAPAEDSGAFPARIESVHFLGNRLHIQARANGERLMVEARTDITLAPQTPVQLRLRRNGVTLLPRSLEPANPPHPAS